MKKLLLFLFVLFLIILFDMEYKSEDYELLLDRKDDYSYYIINNKFTYNELLEIFKDNTLLSLISIKPDIVGLDKFFRLESGNNINYSLNSVRDKIVNNLKSEEDKINYKYKDFTIVSIKVFGKNSDIYDFIKGFY